MEELLQKLIIAILAALLGSLSTYLIFTKIKRDRLISYLSTQLSVMFSTAMRNMKWLELSAQELKAGGTLSNGARYTKDDLSSLSFSREQWVALLKKDELQRLCIVYDRLFEFEAVFDGYCERLNELYTKEGSLEEEEVLMMERRKERLDSIAKSLPLKISRIADLPVTLDNTLGPTHMISSDKIKNREQDSCGNG